MRALFVSTALFGLAVPPAFATEAASAPTAVAASDAAAQKVDIVAKSKVVCRREMPTGSTIPHTVCHTESAGDEAQRALTQQELANEAMRNRMVTVGGRPTPQ